MAMTSDNSPHDLPLCESDRHLLLFPLVSLAKLDSCLASDPDEINSHLLLLNLINGYVFEE